MLVNRGDVELLEVFPAESDPARAWVVEAQHEMHHSRLATARAADERAHELQRIEARFGHAPSASAEIARLKKALLTAHTERDEARADSDAARARDADSQHERALLRRALQWGRASR